MFCILSCSVRMYSHTIVYLYIRTAENLVNAGSSRHKLPRHLQFCVGNTDPSGQNWSNTACRRRHVATCWRHFELRPAVFSVSVFCWYQICWAFSIFGRYCCTVSFGGNTFLRIRGNSFLKNSAGIPFFLQKEGEVYKKGAEAPPYRKKGAPAIFLTGSRQSFDTEYTDQVFLWYRYGKYREIPTEKYRLGIQLY